MSFTSCQHCATQIPSGNRFCGMCGAPVAGGSPAQAASAPGWARRYRGPLWFGGVGSFLFIAGAGLVTVILSAVQVEAAPGLLVEIFGPAVQDQVDGTIGEGVVDLGSGGTDHLETLGLLTLAGLFGGALLAAVGLLLVLIACAWGANRARGGRRSGVVTIASPPPVIQYPVPSFAPPTAATWTQHEPPRPAAAVGPEAPTVVVPPGTPPPPASTALPGDPPTFVKPPR